MIRIASDMKAAFHMMRYRDEHKKLKLSDLKRLYPYMKGHWGQMIAAGFFMIILSLLSLPGPYLTKYIIDDVFIAKNLKMLHYIILILLSLQLLRLVISFLTNYLFTRLNQSILVAIKKDLFQRILKLPLSFFDRTQTGYLMARINEVSGLSFFFSQPVIRLILGIFESIFCIGMLFYLEWRLTLISFLVLPLFYLVAKYHSKGIRAASKDFLEKSAHISRNLQESLSGIGVIKAFATENRESEKIQKSLAQFLNSRIIKSIIETISAEMLILVGAIGGFIVLWYSGVQIIRGNFTIGAYMAFSGYMAKLYGPTQMIASMGLVIQPVAAALHRIAELFDLVTEDEDPNRTIAVSKLKGRITFKDVSFSYDGSKDVLRDINLQIEPGEKVAIVGPSGSGKSTILRLILGFYKAKQGVILIDDVDINKLILTDLRGRIGLVSQDIFLFNDTIKNNILYSNPQASEEQVIKAAMLADAHEFITQLPDGYDTVVGERGVTLSGGQKQRISIARAILKSPDVIIFDEATSYLDNESESRIQEMIRQVFRDNTCLIVAHRLSTIAYVDRIYVLEDGKIVESGSHESLMKSGGRYSSLYSDAHEPLN